MTSDPSTICTLPTRISTATRSYHTLLNRSITARLPLCLPPYVTNPKFYYVGITAFAEVYFTFEREWANALKKTDRLSPTGTQMKYILEKLYIPSLHRSKRLEADLSRLRQRLTDVSETKTLKSSMTDRIIRSLKSKPHTIVAYTWVFYMALFNGGRWIRDQLQGAGPEFWAGPGQESEMDCLSFWDFDGEEDGEDIKADFKRRIEETSGFLSAREQEDIVAEAVQIFQMSQKLVERLDDLAQPNQTSGLVVQTTNNAKSSIQLQGMWSWIWKFEGIWKIRLLENSFGLRREVHVEP